MPWSPAPIELDLLVRHLARLGLQGFIHAHGDIPRLVGDGGKHSAGIGVKALIRAVITDLAHHAAHQVVKVDESAGGDLTQHHHKTSLGRRFTGHTRHRILRQAGVEHGIADLVAQLIRVPFSYRFRGEQVTGRVHKRIGHCRKLLVLKKKFPFWLTRGAKRRARTAFSASLSSSSRSV